MFSDFSLIAGWIYLKISGKKSCFEINNWIGNAWLIKVTQPNLFFKKSFLIFPRWPNGFTLNIRKSGADTANNLMGRTPRKIGLGGVSAAGGSAPQGKVFLGDRLGYPAISMNFKTELYICNTLNFYTFCD